MSAPGCRFRPLALCFQQVPRPAAAGYSRSNREQPILRSTTALSTGSRRRNLQQPCSTRAGVTCRQSCRCRRQRRGLRCSSRHGTPALIVDLVPGKFRGTACQTAAHRRRCRRRHSQAGWRPAGLPRPVRTRRQSSPHGRRTPPATPRVRHRRSSYGSPSP